jgi:hypothetical protein
MIYKFRVISNEIDDFVREIAIDGNQTFLAFHQFIQKELAYDPSQMASFFTTDHDWQKETEITLIDMMDGDNPDLVVMENAAITDYMQSNKQRLLYVFDFFAERAFFIELFDIEDGELSLPSLFLSQGNPPEQIMPDLMVDDGSFDDEFDAEEELDDYFSNQDEFDEDMDFDNIDNGNFRDDY